MREPYFYLREDERVLLKLRPPPTYALALALPYAAILAVLVAAAFTVRTAVGADVPTRYILVPAVGLLALAAFASWRRAATTEYALTEERVYVRVGKLVTKLHFTTHDKVTDMRFRQGPLERAFGLSSLTFATAGGEVHIAGVRDAMGLKAAAETARDAFIRRLLMETAAEPVATLAAPEAGAMAAPAAAAPAEPAPIAPPWEGPVPAYLQPGDTPIWAARPQLVAALGALRSLLGIIPFLLFSNFMEGPRRVWVPLAAIGFVLMFVAIRFMQLRRTEYTATTRRVYARSGLVGTTISQLTYDKITDITFNQDLLGRLFGYGSITLQTAGGSQAPITMTGLAEPNVAKETIERWRDASVRV